MDNDDHECEALMLAGDASSVSIGTVFHATRFVSEHNLTYHT